MSFATPRMTSSSLPSKTTLETSLTALSLHNTRSAVKHDNTKVVDFAGAVSVEPTQPLPSVEVQAKITPISNKSPPEDWSTSLMHAAQQQAHQLKSDALDISAPQASRRHGDTVDNEFDQLCTEFRAMCRDGGQQVPDFDAWVQTNQQRQSVSAMAGGNQLLLKQYLALCQDSLKFEKSVAAQVPRVSNQLHTAPNVQTRLSKLEALVEDHEEGLMTHTAELKSLQPTTSSVKTAADIQMLKTKLQKVNTKLDTHAEKINNLDVGMKHHTDVLQKCSDGLLQHKDTLKSQQSLLNTVDAGLSHHTEVLQTCTDALRQHKSLLLKSEEARAQTLTAGGRKCVANHFTCYDQMRELLK